MRAVLHGYESGFNKFNLKCPTCNNFVQYKFKGMTNRFNEQDVFLGYVRGFVKHKHVKFTCNSCNKTHESNVLLIHPKRVKFVPKVKRTYAGIEARKTPN